ncbi:FAD-dependent oxidoreductase [Streptomyces sp. NBC_00433]
MDKQIVIVGGGTAGTLLANRLHRTAGSGVRIVVLDSADRRAPETRLLMALGLYGGGAPRAPDDLWLRDGIGFRLVAVASVDADRAELFLTDGTTLGYDVLVLATGRHPLPRGLDGAGPDLPPGIHTVGGAGVHVQVENVADAVRRQLGRGAVADGHRITRTSGGDRAG